MKLPGSTRFFWTNWSSLSVSISRIVLLILRGSPLASVWLGSVAAFGASRPPKARRELRERLPVLFSYCLPYLDRFVVVVPTGEIAVGE